ncbi:hypothetical protein FD16_GL001887 [Paucilactobacillus suebicus DSM 5007 = KCTC 3549]|uniref:Uncharacterized protein n=1 Tax=Paucilactobacillus suebicus DSM 5007 = KCTC 3549 TaxID=1423807 RepID=A0A0R1VV10_9LACO|nr:hypothetical protein FD16_GL001887 [Paucilactobacillus suebicus DSM 5007 = KCTC 3549]
MRLQKELLCKSMINLTNKEFKGSQKFSIGTFNNDDTGKVVLNDGYEYISNPKPAP